MATREEKRITAKPTDKIVDSLKTAEKPPKEKIFVIPKSLALCADMMYTLDKERLALDKQSEELKKKVTQLKEHIINNLPASQATGIAGKLVRVRIEPKERPSVEDWDAFYAFIVKQSKKDPGAWALLQKRPGDAAIKEYWEAGKEVPGVGHFQYKSLSVNKL